MQYCGAAPVAKMVPYSESVLSRCGNSRYRYCELYLAMANPGTAAAMRSKAFPSTTDSSTPPITCGSMSAKTASATRGWMPSSAARSARPERVSFVWQSGQHRATAVITVNGVDHDVVFPNPFLLTGCNLYLRTNPSPLTSRPVHGGLALRRRGDAGDHQNTCSRAPPRAHWMEEEQRRMSEFLQQLARPRRAVRGRRRNLRPPASRATSIANQMLALFHEFFSPMRGKRDPS